MDMSLLVSEPHRSGIAIQYRFVRYTHNASVGDFYGFLPLPPWFMAHFLPAFEQHRKETHGIVFMAYEGQQPVGCCYVEFNPDHLHFGRKIPIFGWIFAENRDCFNAVMDFAEMYAKVHGFSELRGPINVPFFFGGWGIPTEGEDLGFVIENSYIHPEIAFWLEERGYAPTTRYFTNRVTEFHPIDNPFPEINFRIESWPMESVAGNTNLIKKLDRFLKANFQASLPDVTLRSGASEFLQILAEVPHGEDFYRLVLHPDTNEIVAVMLELPNVFQIWQGKPLTQTSLNTVVIDPKFRGRKLFNYLYREMWERLNNRGITDRVGSYIWDRNIASQKCFLTMMHPVTFYMVYQKNLNGKTINFPAMAKNTVEGDNEFLSYYGVQDKEVKSGAENQIPITDKRGRVAYPGANIQIESKRCEFCKKFLKRTIVRFWNVEQDPPEHLFCSKQCKEQWIFMQIHENE